MWLYIIKIALYALCAYPGIKTFDILGKKSVYVCSLNRRENL
jgi:hypothetical protein